MKEINCLGDICPIPIIKINKGLKSMHSGEQLKVITDHSCVLQSIKTHFKITKFTLQIDEVLNGVWEIIITII